MDCTQYITVAAERKKDSISGEKKEELSSISSGMGFQTEP